ncbi:MAG: hypothetical protein OSJ45_04430 [Lachnospiraceae bacterium]|nr:hypothetical protein [Lachnospiraceae bacterium]
MKYLLKNGKIVVIRKPEPEDAGSILLDSSNCGILLEVQIVILRG